MILSINDLYFIKYSLILKLFSHLLIQILLQLCSIIHYKLYYSLVKNYAY